MPHTPQPIGCRATSLAILTVALWSANPVAVRFSVDTLPPLAVAGVRFALASLVMIGWCRWEGAGYRLDPDQRLPTFLAGVALFVQISLFNIGVSLSNASHGAMIISTFVFWVVLIEHAVTREDRLSRRRALGLGIAFAGLLWVLLPDRQFRLAQSADAPTLVGDLVLVGSALVLGFKVVFVRHAVKRVPPGKLILWHDVIGTVLFWIASLGWEELRLAQVTHTAVWAIAYQGFIVAGFCFAIQAWLLRQHSATQIAVFGFATPPLGVMFSVVLRREPITASLLGATACVAVGILLVNWKSPPSSR